MGEKGSMRAVSNKTRIETKFACVISSRNGRMRAVSNKTRIETYFFLFGNLAAQQFV